MIIIKNNFLVERKRCKKISFTTSSITVPNILTGQEFCFVCRCIFSSIVVNAGAPGSEWVLNACTE